MGIKYKFTFFVLIFLSIFVAHADTNNWYDAVLRSEYTDHQISYWNKIVVDAKQESNPIIKSGTETVYLYNDFVITENKYNLTGKFSMAGVPTVGYVINNGSFISASLFVSRNGDITLQIWRQDKRLFSVKYFRNKYQYTYFANGEVSYSFEVGD
jgi:hypothetical protein